MLRTPPNYPDIIASDDSAEEDWTIADFNETQGHRPTDGLQQVSGDKFYRAENLEGKIIDGTVIGVKFYKGDPWKNYVPLTDKMENYFKNLLNMITEWTDGCITFLDVDSPKYKHRITQNLITWRGYYQDSAARALTSGIYGGCSVNYPYWGRINDVIIQHELFHCMGKV